MGGYKRMIELDRNNKTLVIPQGIGQGSVTVQTEGYTEEEMNTEKNKAFQEGKNSVHLESITVEENGIYTAENGGYKRVVVNTPTIEMEDKEFVCTQNGDFEILPPQDFDGMKKVLLKINVDGTEPSEVINITANGVYNVSDKGVADVQVPVGVFPKGTKEIVSNGEYDVTIYEKVNVKTSAYPEPIGEIEINDNGTYDVKDIATAVVNVNKGTEPTGTLEIENKLGDFIVKKYAQVNVKMNPNDVDWYLQTLHLDLKYVSDCVEDENGNCVKTYLQKVAVTPDGGDIGAGGFALYVNVHAGDTIRFIIDISGGGDSEGLGWYWRDGNWNSYDYDNGKNVVLEHTYQNDFEGWIGSTGYREFGANLNGSTTIKDWGSVPNYCNIVLYDSNHFYPEINDITKYTFDINYLINKNTGEYTHSKKENIEPKVLHLYGCTMRMTDDKMSEIDNEKTGTIASFYANSANSTEGVFIMSKALICAKKLEYDYTWRNVESAYTDQNDLISGIYIGRAKKLTINFTNLSKDNVPIRYRVYVSAKDGIGYRTATGITNLTKTIDLTALGQDSIKYFIIKLDGYYSSTKYVNFEGVSVSTLGFSYSIEGY